MSKDHWIQQHLLCDEPNTPHPVMVSMLPIVFSRPVVPSSHPIFKLSHGIIDLVAGIISQWQESLISISMIIIFVSSVTDPPVMYIDLSWWLEPSVHSSQLFTLPVQWCVQWWTVHQCTVLRWWNHPVYHVNRFSTVESFQRSQAMTCSIAMHCLDLDEFLPLTNKV